MEIVRSTIDSCVTRIIKDVHVPARYSNYRPTMSKSLTNIGSEPEYSPVILIVFLLAMVPFGVICWLRGAPSPGTLPFTLTLAVAGTAAGALLGLLCGLTGWVLAGGVRTFLLYTGIGTSLWVSFFAGIGLLVTGSHIPLGIVLLVLLVRGWRPSFPLLGTVRLSGTLVTGWLLGGSLMMLFAGTVTDNMIGTTDFIGWHILVSGAVAGAVILAATGVLTSWVRWVQGKMNTTRWWTGQNRRCWAVTGVLTGALVFPLLLLTTLLRGSNVNSFLFNIALTPLGVLAGVAVGCVFERSGNVISGWYQTRLRNRS